MNKFHSPHCSHALFRTGLALLIGAGSLTAANWQTSGTGNWDVAANWSGGAVPTNLDDVLLQNVVFNGPNTVVIPDGYLAIYSFLTIDSNSNHFTTLDIYGTLIGSSANIASRGGVRIKGGQWLDTGSLSVGSGGGSFIEITDDGLLIVQEGASIGGGGSGSVTVTSGGWSVENDIKISSPASARLVVNGGLVTSQNGIVATGGVSGVGGGGDGTVTVSSGTWKIASNLTIAGIYSSGTVNVSGGLLEVGGNTYVGLDSTYSKATVNLTGNSGNRGTLSTSRVISAGTAFPYTGTNTFTFDGGILQARTSQTDFITAFRPTDVSISSGGAFIDSNGNAIGIGNALWGSGGLTKLGAGTLTLSGANTYAGGTIVKSGTLNLAGSITHLAAETRIGNASGDNGYLTIAGGTLRNTYGFLGATTGATGGATISSGAWINSAELYVGYSGIGSLQVDGGSVSAQNIFLGYGGSGAATVNAGTLTTAGYLMVGINSGTGSLQINGGTVTSALSQIGSGATGSVTVTGGTWNNAGDLLVGVNSKGSLSVNGGVVNVSGTILTPSGSNLSTISISGSSGARGVLSTNQFVKAGGTASVNFNGGILQARTSQVDFFSLFNAGDVTIGQGGAFIDSNGCSIGITTTLSGSGGLTKMGAGTLILSGSNSFIGGTVIESGTLRVGHDKALGTGGLSINAGTLDLNGRDATVTSLSGSSGAIVTVGSGSESSLIVNQNTNTTYAGRLQDGSGGALYLVKSGTGTLTLTGSNSYTGETIVGDGTLLIFGDNSASSNVFVDDHAAFGGTGTSGDVRVTDLGILTPGNSPGLLTIDGDLTMDANSSLVMEFTGTANGAFDQLAVSGFFNAAGANLYLDVSYAAQFGDSFLIFSDERPDFGDFVISTNLGGGLSWDTSQLSSAGILSIIPEPGTAALLALGGLIVTVRRRRA